MLRRSAFLLALTGSLLGTPALAEIKVGLAAPLSGQLAAVGQQLRRGTEQAVADLNAKGGVLGQQISLTVVDDGGLPAQAVAVANRLATDRVSLVVGHLQTGTTVPATQQVYEEEGIVTITPTATSPEVTDRGLELIFRTCGRDDQQGAIAADWLVKHYAGRRVAVIHDQTTYGKGLADATKTAINSKGLKEVLYSSLSVGERDFSALVTRLKAANVDAVYFGGLYNEAGLLVRQSREAGLTAQFVSGDTLASEEFWAIAGATGNGLVMTFSADARQSPAAKDAVARFRAKGEEPGAYTLYAYAAVEAWAHGATVAKTTDGRKVAAAMRSGPNPTVIGPLSFDAKGDRTSTDYILYRWNDGKYAPVQP
jgi:branched-chain amino acid transport system substrate-binding protein